jgi:exodeoxyribonuclease V gamma subunit
MPSPAAIPPPPPAPTPGLLALHGNRLETLADALAEWLLRQPLQPLQREVLLVQSNGMAEWLKIALAQRLGVCAAFQVELPARFLWTASRQVLGSDAVPAQSALDEAPLTWRLMALLPALLRPPVPRVCEPLAAFLQDGSATRLLQLARRLADLFDQYQVYRGDWLQAWAGGANTVTDSIGRAIPLPPGQGWQPWLWRALLDTLPESAAQASRPQLQQRFVGALESARPGTLPLPGRVVLFGTSHLAPSLIHALAAMARHSQVMMVLPNPCRWHWADAIAGREWLGLQRRRQPLRAGRDLAALPLEAMHLHAHPLLAAWGRQQRDFLRALEAFDDAQAARERFGIGRVDFFDESPGATQLQQLQAHIRELLPEADTPRTPLAGDDRSIVFHVCHGVQRELEVLQDALLHALAEPFPADAAPLQPRDIVVMVPDIAGFAPAIDAVFGAVPPDDPRHIPYGIADLQDRGRQPVLRALEWLLSLPQQRCTLAELHDLLTVPAVAARFGLQAELLPTLTRWMQEAGIRWGLDAVQLQAAGLSQAQDLHTLAWGLRRLWMGYAAGEVLAAGAVTPPDAGDDPVHDRLSAVVPLDEVAGLDAACVGALADLLLALQHWARAAARPASPAAWVRRGRRLLAAFFRAAGESAQAEEQLLAQAGEALQAWGAQCAQGGLRARQPLEVMREAWLSGLQPTGLARRFRAGGVTFCTLMPLRAVPFEMVCLLGMNEADYPRRVTRSDFDLMGLAGLARPGDRARRDDDRQLMLEALLSARRRLHISWTGHGARDPAEHPPSVLVTQLREHLVRVWGEAALRERTVHHPLQPFSRRNFEAAAWWVSHAREWRVVHEPVPPVATPTPRSAGPEEPVWPASGLTLEELTRFLRDPQRDFCRRQLKLVFEELPSPLPESEDFDLDGLQAWQLTQHLLDRLEALEPAGAAASGGVIDAVLERLRLAGALPPGAPGRRAATRLGASVARQWTAWLACRPARGEGQLALQVQAVCPPDEAATATGPAVTLSDQIHGLAPAAADGLLRQARLTPGRLLEAPDRSAPRLRGLVRPWVDQLAAAAAGQPLELVLVGSDAVLTLAAPPVAEAVETLQRLLTLWRRGQRVPVPLPWRTAVQASRQAGVTGLAAAYEGEPGRPGDRSDPVLARFWPDLDALLGDSAFEAAVQAVVLPLQAHARSRCHVRRLDAQAAEDAPA